MHIKQNDQKKQRKERTRRNSSHIGRPPKIDVAAITEETYGYVLQEVGANSIQDIVKLRTRENSMAEGFM